MTWRQKAAKNCSDADAALATDFTS